jgi:hypothetical protein
MIKRTFKDILINDISSAFINTDEFSDIHSVDGKNIPVLVDENEIIEREKKMKSNMDGVYVRQKLIYVKAADFGAAPAVGRALMFDGKRYQVLDVTDEEGVYSILMEINRSR